MTLSLRLLEVGRKMASVLLSNVFRKPAIAVDTHLFHFSHRLKLDKSIDPNKIKQALCEIIPHEK